MRHAASAGEPARSESTAERRACLLVFGTLLFCYAYFPPRWADWNQNARLDLTVAIVERGTLSIDAYYENTGDYAVHAGHVYAGKAPGLSLVAVPIYLAFRSLTDNAPVRAVLQRASASGALARTLREGGTGLLENKIYFAAALYAGAFAAVALPSALLGVLLFSFLGVLLPERLPRAVLVLAYGLATVVFPYSTVFYGHQPAAVLLFVSFYLLWRMRRGQLAPRWLWAVGALQGLAVLVEFPTLGAVLLMCAYAFSWLDRKWEIVKLGCGALPMVLLLGWYNTSAFGSPFATAYQYLGRFPEISNTTLVGFGPPSWEALWGLTFSPYRGLFFFSPFLLLAGPGSWLLVRRREWRPEVVLWAGMVTLHLLLIAGWYDWRGGFAIGPRNLIAVIPFLMPPVAFCWRVWQQRPALQATAWGLVLASFALVWTASVSGQDFPSLDIRNPVAQFFWPKFCAGDITRNLGMFIGLRAWWSVLPPVLLVAAVPWRIRCREMPLGAYPGARR
jgi:hypothetical protein